MPSTTAPADTALHDVADRIDRLMLWTRRQLASSMTSATAGTLDSLLHFGPLRMSDLAERERISQPGMTTVVNRLEKAGLACRAADPADGRVTLVHITAAGHDALRQRHVQRGAVLLEHLRALPAHHQRALTDALDALGELVRSDAGDTSTD